MASAGIGRLAQERPRLASVSTPLVTGFPRESSLRWPLLLEAGLVVAAVCALFPGFAILATNDTGRDGRFAEQGLAVRGLPDPVLPELCATYASLAESVVRERLCGRVTRYSPAERVEHMPRSLESASVRATQAFLVPLQAAAARRAELRQQQQDGRDELLTLGDAIDVAEADVPPFLERYAMSSDSVDGPRPLGCAFDLVQRLLGDAASQGVGGNALRANAILLLGAAFDGHPAASSAAAATLPGARAVSARCAGLDMREAVVAASALMADARAAPLALAKNEAMRDLLHTARWQWAAWAGLGLVLLNIARRRGPSAVGAALAIAAWAVAAWIGRVPWPFEGGNAIMLGSESASLFSMPANFVIGLLVAALCLLVAAPWLRKRFATAPQREGSIVTYPGLVFLTGLGWLILLDLSANGHFGTRYLALYHQGHLWLGMLIFMLAAFIRQPLGRSIAWCLSVVDGAASRVGKRLGGLGSAALLVCFALLLNAAVAAVLLNVRQLTSEIGRMWLIVGGAWFFFLRGTPFTERLARSGDSLASLFRYIWPLLFVVIVLVGAMVITRDMGPLLIAGYASGAFVAASIAMWRYQRTGTTGVAYALAIVLFAGWIVATTAALFWLGAIDDVTAARLENAAAPLASANDHHLVSTRVARRRIRPRCDSVVRLWRLGYVRRRPGPDPERLYVHGARRNAGLDRCVGSDARLCGLALRRRSRSRARHPGRAAPCPDQRSSRQRRAGAAELADRHLDGAGDVSTRGDGRRQSGRHSADRRDVSFRQLRYDVARPQHGDARAGRQRQCHGRGQPWLNCAG